MTTGISAARTPPPGRGPAWAVSDRLQNPVRFPGDSLAVTESPLPGGIMRIAEGYISGLMRLALRRRSHPDAT
jgi:hypothetical protein